MRWTHEDDFDRARRKEVRQERKILQAKDRSKYKKTDQNKPAPPTLNQPHQRGRVLSIKSEGIIVDIDGQPYLCTLRGALKKEKNRQKNLVTVGDFVHVITSSENEGSIAFVESRYSHLSRAESLTQRREQLIAANIDQVLITTSVFSPPLKPKLIDRYIIAARKGNMQPIVLVNKIDLLTQPPEHLDPHTVAEEKELLDTFCQAYGNLGFPLIKISTVTGEGLDELKGCMQNKTSVFSGQSGTGKSSLINATLNMDLKTGHVIEKTKKGMHTTTSAQLIPLEGGGFCIDTPGIRSFGVWNLKPEEIRFYFDDIHELGQHCQYPDCTHRHEPGCAVLEAVDAGRLSTLRFDSYSALMASVEAEHKQR